MFAVSVIFSYRLIVFNIHVQTLNDIGIIKLCGTLEKRELFRK